LQVQNLNLQSNKLADQLAATIKKTQKDMTVKDKEVYTLEQKLNDRDIELNQKDSEILVLKEQINSMLELQK